MRFLGVHITILYDKNVCMTQPNLIRSILQELKLINVQGNVTGKDIPMISRKILTRHEDYLDFVGHFHYRRIIGMLNYLERCTHPDISYAVHQCALYCENPKKEHGMVIKWIGRYLSTQPSKGIMSTLKEEDIISYVDADYAGNWDIGHAIFLLHYGRSYH